ncbi:MAG: heavy-metal-associated domain-containing protein [Gemmatimonadota bacterium]
MPLATTGPVHPVWAMIAMAASVTAVLANSFGGRGLRGRNGSPEPGDERAARPEPAPAEAVGTEAAGPTPVSTDGPARIVMDVPDIHCSGCESNVRLLLGDREGIEKVDADAEANKVLVTYRPEAIGLTEIEEALASAGYRVRRAHPVAARANSQSVDEGTGKEKRT